MHAYLAALLVFAGSSLAVPASRRATTPACTNFPTNSTANASNFTLSAQLAGAPQHLVPLTLTALVPSLIESVLAVAPDAGAPTTFALVDSGLSSTTGRAAVSQTIAPTSGLLEFVSETSLAPSPEYCGLIGADVNGVIAQYPVLAVNGSTDDLYICQGAASLRAAQVVVYNPAPGDGLFNYTSCAQAYLLLTPA